MAEAKKERRKYQRHDMAMKVYFRVSYDIRTKVKFHLLDLNDKRASNKSYSGVTRNISVEGLSFDTRKELSPRDVLLVEIYPPHVKDPVILEGEVCWCRELCQKSTKNKMFTVGLKLIAVENDSVSDSIYFDKEYDVFWSMVLETVFGNFKDMIKTLKKEKTKKEKNRKKIKKKFKS